MRTRCGEESVLRKVPAVGWGAVLFGVLGMTSPGVAQTALPTDPAASEVALACVQTGGVATAWAAGFLTNVVEVTYGAAVTDHALGLACVSIDGKVETGASPTGMIAWSKATYSAASAGTSVEIGRVSGGVHATGLTNAFGILAWSHGSFATNPATVRIEALDGAVSANAGPGGGTAAAVCARTAVDVTLSSGAAVFGGTYGWDAGDGSATNAAAVLQALLSKVRARTATAAESNALAAAAAGGYAVLGGTGPDTVRFASENVAVFGTVALGGGYDTVAVSGLPSGRTLKLPAVTGAELLAVTNCPDAAVSNAAVFAEIYVGSNALCRLKDPAYTVAGLYGRGTLVPQSALTVTNRIEVGRFGEAPLGSRLTVTGSLTLGDGVVCALRAAETNGVWTNDTVVVSGALTVAWGGTVDVGCSTNAPLALYAKRVVMTAAGGIVNPGLLATWTLEGTGRDGEAKYMRTVRAEGNNVVVSVAVGGTLIRIF